jgi:hypothetical protein
MQACPISIPLRMVSIRPSRMSTLIAHLTHRKTLSTSIQIGRWIHLADQRSHRTDIRSRPARNPEDPSLRPHVPRACRRALLPHF